MRITIITLGSRGDVQPYIALAKGLQARGHEVLLGTHAEFENFVRSYNVDFALMEGDPRAVLASDTGEDWKKASRSPLLLVQTMRKLAEDLMQQLTLDCLKASRNADIVLFSVLGMFPAYSVIEKHRKPAVAAYLQPSTPTRAFSTYRFPTSPPWLNRGRSTYNLFSHVVMEQLFWSFLSSSINRARSTKLKLPPAPLRAPLFQPSGKRQLRLYGYSRYVVPKPADWRAQDRVCGFWFLDRLPSWQPPPELVKFIQAGAPPISIGFGSMNNRNRREITQMILMALEQTGQRGVLVTGWNGLDDEALPNSVFPIDGVPYDWLFPQMAAVVHHGGAGTTAEGLRAGKASVLIPFFSDQPFWATRVHALGVGPQPIPQKELNVAKLVAAINLAVNDKQLQSRAASLGELIRDEQGVTQAVAVLERYWESRERRVHGHASLI